MTVATDTDVEALRTRVRELAIALDGFARLRHVEEAGERSWHPAGPYADCTAQACRQARELVGEFALPEL